MEGGESGQGQGPPLHLINDERGSGREASTRFTDEGEVVVDGDVRQFNLLMEDEEGE